MPARELIERETIDDHSRHDRRARAAVLAAASDAVENRLTPAAIGVALLLTIFWNCTQALAVVL